VSYEVFAPFYDAVMGDRAGEADYLRGLIERYHPQARTVLELACGTGAVLEQLEPSYEVTGLDLSRPMLDVAKAKLPSARFVHSDMTSFDLPDHFDVVLCVFDSINHLTRFAQWEAVFRRAREHLDRRGLFLFDMNTAAKLERFSRLPPLPQWFGDGHLVILDVRPPADGVYVWNLRLFERLDGSTYRLHEEDIPEVAFPRERVLDSLRKRFSTIRVFDERRGRPRAASERLYFACRA
jgi:SAM-dependent methyltransferase